eukprot:3856239-Rhodomonas_salina.1
MAVLLLFWAILLPCMVVLLSVYGGFPSVFGRSASVYSGINSGEEESRLILPPSLAVLAPDLLQMKTRDFVFMREEAHLRVHGRVPGLVLSEGEEARRGAKAWLLSVLRLRLLRPGTHTRPVAC